VKLTRRHRINLAMVAFVSFFGLVWASVGLVGINPFDESAVIRVRLATAAGALPGARVTYLGVPIGKVESATLVEGGVELKLVVQPKGPMARELRADVEQKSSLGEPFVDLRPADPEAAVAGDPDGAVVPVERTSTPKPLTELLNRMDEVLGAVEPEDLGAIADGFSGIVGKEGDIQAALAGWAEVSDVVGRRRAELGQFLAAAAELTAALDTHHSELAGSLSGAARLGDVLGRRTDQIEDVLVQGARLGTEASDVLARSWDDLNEVLTGLDTTFHNMAARPSRLKETMYWLPEFMERISYTIEGDALNVAVGSSLVPIVPGYQPRLGIPIYGEGLRLDKILVPSLAQRVDIDLRGQRNGMTVVYLSPAEARYALSGMDQLLTLIEQKRAEFGAPPSPPTKQP
jgi:phospholipid/cholesterol/gamma-HCH transport system substrate-binding protein